MTFDLELDFFEAAGMMDDPPPSARLGKCQNELTLWLGAQECFNFAALLPTAVRVRNEYWSKGSVTRGLSPINWRCCARQLLCVSTSRLESLSLKSTSTCEWSRGEFWITFHFATSRNISIGEIRGSRKGGRKSSKGRGRSIMFLITNYVSICLFNWNSEII